MSVCLPSGAGEAAEAAIKIAVDAHAIAHADVGVVTTDAIIDIDMHKLHRFLTNVKLQE